jgi:signal transduction histidine kinase
MIKKAKLESIELKTGSIMLLGKKNRPFSTVSNYFGTPRIDSVPSPASLSARAARRFSVIGEMTGGIAHDFRSILSVIDCGLRLADSNLGDPDKARTFIAGAREGVERGVRLTSKLLDFGRQDGVKPYAADLSALLKNLERFLQYGAGPSTRIVLECAPAIPKCLVDPDQFAAAILNLVINARDATTGGEGEVRINTSRCESGYALSKLGSESAYVRVRVQDNGSGMPGHVARRVFEPFFTTKGYKGTGLGVPQAGAFMRHIGGHVAVSSEPGRGTTVDLFFPAIES